MNTIPVFTRLTLAFTTFFALLLHGRIPDRTLTAVGMAPVEPEPPPATPPEPQAPPAVDGAGAARLLALFQRDGRLVDFLMEDLSAFSDDQVGAAVRNVHAGCRQALQRYVTLEPVVADAEGASVTVEAGTDPAMVTVIGNAGRPPFQGVVRHRGWVVSRMALPAAPPSARDVVAPAEVEVP
jgi:hypothetical protein